MASINLIMNTKLANVCVSRSILPNLSQPTFEARAIFFVFHESSWKNSIIFNYCFSFFSAILLANEIICVEWDSCQSDFIKNAGMRRQTNKTFVSWEKIKYFLGVGSGGTIGEWIMSQRLPRNQLDIVSFTVLDVTASEILFATRRDWLGFIIPHISAR